MNCKTSFFIPSEKIQDYCAAAASKKPRFSLIPPESIRALAARFELGEEKYGPTGKSWNALTSQNALSNDEWVIARAEHVIDHALLYIAKLKGFIPDDGDDDAAAIMWGGCCLFEAKRKKG
jgi:hypothetical protein